MIKGTLDPLPFNLRRLPNDGAFVISNLLGAYAEVGRQETLEALVDGRANVLPQPVLEELVAKGFVAPQDELEVRTRLLGVQFASQIASSLEPPALFIVVPTLRCNHSCGYCQVSRVPEQTPGYTLENARIDEILAVIAMTPSKRIKIEFQGGEPLLSIGFIEKFLESAATALADRNVEFVVCSNLMSLPDDTLAILKDFEVGLSVSLDGPMNLHNANRPTTDRSSYQRIVSNIKLARDRLGPDRVSCVSTISKRSLAWSREIVDSYVELGLRSIFLRPISPYGFAATRRTSASYSPREFFEFYARSLDYIVEINSAYPLVEETSVIHLKRLFRPHQNAYTDLKSPAGYVLGTLVFNYDGNIFGSDEARMIWEQTKSPELVLGNVSTFSRRDLIDRAASVLSDTFLTTNPGCDDCVYQTACGADPMHHLSTQGDHVGNKAKSDFCVHQLHVFDHLLKIMIRDDPRKEVLTRWLNH